MQSRISFNAGEFSPELASRSDIEYYFKACSQLENWDISQMGGVRRRKGMRKFAKAVNADSRLIPYIYSYAEGKGLRFLVEANEEQVNVLAENGALVKAFRNGVGVKFKFSLMDLRHKQVNAMLFLTCQDNPPMVLECKDGITWTLKAFEFKHYPWRYVYEDREKPIQIKVENYQYNIEFDADEDATEKSFAEGDVLRASYWLDQNESGYSLQEARNGTTIVASLPSTAKAGNKYAIASELTVKYYTCTNKFIKSDNWADGMDSPANYTSFFQEANDLSSLPTVSYSGLKDYFTKTSASEIAKGAKIAIQYGYWEYWTCIKDFKIGTAKTFEDYPEYFVRGLAVGDALPCKGSWLFYCSGLWYGSYEVRRHYDKTEIDDTWESRGITWSRNEAASNTQLTGTEKDEECYLRLFLTRSRYMNSQSLLNGFIPDSCNNRLIVQPYKHDMLLKAYKTEDGKTLFEDITPIKLPLTESRSVMDWSWCAFNSRYGYPLICETFSKRLIFASTKQQPQSLWFSRVDDIDNFMSGEEDDAAISLTMLTTTQNPICWIKPRGNRIMLGTSEAEYIISALQANAFTSKNATAVDHGYIGSSPTAVLGMNDKMLYVERGGGRVWTFEYSLEIDGWRSSDITIFAPHIAQKHGGFKRSSMVRKPDTVAMYILGDGQLALCTYNSLHEVKAWHRWTTNGYIYDVCGMPYGDANDRIFLLIDRAGEVQIEVVDEESDYTDNGEDYVSTLQTLPLVNPNEEYMSKHNTPVISAFIGESFELNGDNVQVSTDGENWYNSEMLDGTVTRGWHKFIAPRGWGYLQFACFKVTGNQSFNLLALQA